MARVRMMGGGKRGRGKGEREDDAREEKLARMSLESVRARKPGAEQTYLQRLNKTSLCQTIQGMAGHSLCGVDGWREVGSRDRYEEEGGGTGMEGVRRREGQ